MYIRCFSPPDSELKLYSVLNIFSCLTSFPRYHNHVQLLLILVMQHFIIVLVCQSCSKYEDLHLWHAGGTSVFCVLVSAPWPAMWCNSLGFVNLRSRHQSFKWKLLPTSDHFWVTDVYRLQYWYCCLAVLLVPSTKHKLFTGCYNLCKLFLSHSLWLYM